MVRKFIILLCLCCAVLCAIVGYLSMQVDEQSDKREGEALSVSCEKFIETPPTDTARILLTGFVPGKFYSEFDADGDGNWDHLVVPLFPNKKKQNQFGLKAVLVHFKDVKSKAELKEILASRKLDSIFFPQRQDLSEADSSRLAIKYTNIDLARSVSLHCGYPSSNPILGATSLMFSKIIGGGALGIAFLTLLSFLFSKRKPKELSITEMVQSANTAKRAGLPEI